MTLRALRRCSPLAVAAAAGCSPRRRGGLDRRRSKRLRHRARSVFAAGFTSGFLTVPENRAREDGRTIRLAVAVGRSRSETPAPHAVLYPAGGAGNGAGRRLHPFDGPTALALTSRMVPEFRTVRRGYGIASYLLT